MIVEVRDYDRLLKATEEHRDLCPIADLDKWISLPNNLMFVEGDDVGLATFEYRGLYNVHWYFKSRGREAIDVARRMLANLFENYGAQAVRGLVRDRLKASRWATRQVGLKSMGFIDNLDGSKDELFVVTKDEFMKGFKDG